MLFYLCQDRCSQLCLGALPPPRRRSVFSLRRPSTSGSEMSTNMSNPGHRPRPLASPSEGRITEETVQLTPISSNSAGHSSSPNYSHPFNYPTSLCATVNSERSSGRPTSSNGGPRVEPEARLEVLHTSSSLPSQTGACIPRQTLSSDGYPSVSSTLSSDSGVQISSTLREAITDPRPIINFNRSGSVTSGTLEGLVERLINHFSELVTIQLHPLFKDIA